MSDRRTHTAAVNRRRPLVSGTVWNGLPRHVTPRLCLLYLISPGAWKLISLGAISTDGPYCCNVRAVTPSHFDHFNRSCYVMLCPFLDSRGIWSNQLMPVKLYCHCLLMVTVQFHLQTYSVRKANINRWLLRLRLSSSCPGRDIGRRDFSTGVDRWQLSLHHAKLSSFCEGLP